MLVGDAFNKHELAKFLRQRSELTSHLQVIPTYLPVALITYYQNYDDKKRCIISGTVRAHDKATHTGVFTLSDVPATPPAETICASLVVPSNRMSHFRKADNTSDQRGAGTLFSVTKFRHCTLFALFGITDVHGRRHATRTHSPQLVPEMNRYLCTDLRENGAD